MTNVSVIDTLVHILHSAFLAVLILFLRLHVAILAILLDLVEMYRLQNATLEERTCHQIAW
jgi:hypothetical protein